VALKVDGGSAGFDEADDAILRVDIDDLYCSQACGRDVVDATALAPLLAQNRM
jgi:hypothetical protein